MRHRLPAPRRTRTPRRRPAWCEEAGRKAVLVPGDLTREEACQDAGRPGGRRARPASTSSSTTRRTRWRSRRHRRHHHRAARPGDEDQLYAMFWLCKMALPHMHPGAAIINTSSIQASSPSPELLDYATTKAGIVNFTQRARREPGRAGHPGELGRARPDLDAARSRPPCRRSRSESFGDADPAGRPGQPAEVAPAYVFLASPESSYVTGEVVAVTGGDRDGDGVDLAGSPVPASGRGCRPACQPSPGELDLQLVVVAELHLDLEVDLVGDAHGDPAPSRWNSTELLRASASARACSRAAASSRLMRWVSSMSNRSMVSPSVVACPPTVARHGRNRAHTLRATH